MQMKKIWKKIKYFTLLILVLTSLACQANQTILNSQPKPVPSPSNAAEQPKDAFQKALRGVQSGDFTYIFVLRRKDGGEIKGEDGRFIRSVSPAETNQFVVTDDNLVVIIGTNFPYPPENLDLLHERFNIEDFSKPESKELNKNANASNN